MIIYRPSLKPKNRHLQSILASAKLRLRSLRHENPVKTAQQAELIKTPLATLQGFYSPHPQDNGQLAILIHGWEGSAESTYLQLMAHHLYNAGISVYRLNLRDHGDSHHLNEDLFHSCRLAEVVAALQQLNQRFSNQQQHLIGFSLGGNFAVRAAAAKELNFTGVYAVSPPVNPENSMHAIEASKLYGPYFLHKWKKSLLKKQQLFPHLFEGTDWQSQKSLQTLTEALVLKHTEFDTASDYFQGYSLTPDLIKKINIPTQIITAWDDPVIPFADFSTIDRLSNIKLVTTPLGGHCGFIKNWRLDSWVEDYIINEITS
ncbi:YheT family hydrolase [Marinicella gelatinilytica]|uniref:YheT family hydrolase n=1 Tax=Marinicella gelatinilytica TaxID=2996017 RepID=UPI0022609F84|nr:alpha/beta fold hydrolase [Marinicella gelatinilytica]MCX7545327.1 alpha/beta fold hydrolase [Marinicella gelatinilytica]